MDGEYVKIKVKELTRLLNAEVKLSALESGGVDNWEWYGESQPDDTELWTEEEVLNNYEEAK